MTAQRPPLRAAAPETSDYRPNGVLVTHHEAPVADDCGHGANNARCPTCRKGLCPDCWAADRCHAARVGYGVTPYYQDANATLYLGDCREILPALKPLTVQLLVTDPPYGVAFQSNRGHGHDAIAGDDGSLDVPAALALACKLLGRGRHAYVFGPRDLVQAPLTASVELIWDKTVVGMGDLSCPWSTSHEPITFCVYEPSKANREKGYGNLVARMRQGSVLRVPRTNGAATTRHPTEKPVALLRQLIESSSVMGEIVLDPFVGVGSTLVAATLEGRKSVGIEIDERYCEAAAKRLAATVEAGVA